MKKKLLALVLAVMMTVGCFAGLGAAVGQDTDFAALSVEDQYAAIMAAGSEADAQALFDTLDAEQQAALTAYADRQQENTDTSKETDPIPAVNYTNVAPLVTANKVSQPAKARLMSARSTARPIEKGKTVDGLVINKTATANDDGTYNIKLEAYTTGTVSTSETTKPTDIVLVLDQSGSMDETMKSYTYTAAYPGNSHSGSYYVKYRDSYVRVSWCSDCRAWTDGCTDGWFWHNPGTEYTPKTSASDTASGHVQFYSRGSATEVKRLTALKKAVTSFAEDVAKKAKGPDGILGTDDDVNHRIAVVGFASGNPSNRLYYNSEIFVGANQYQYNRLTSQNYLDAMQSMDTKAGVDNISKSINALDAEGATYTNLGIEMANGIFAANPVENNSRNRIVVVFTDGQPGRSSYDSGIANAAINQANTTKNTYNATVYTVGIFENADATSAGNQNGTNAEKSNWFMQKLSSNNGTPQDPSYYLSASDSDTLSTIFQKISNQISESKIDLGSQTVIKDTVTKYFDMPTDASKVSVKSYDCTGAVSGKPTWSETGTDLKNAVTLDTENNTVNVTGFDFNANYVTEKGRDENDPKQAGDFHGRKLVIEFTVTAKDGFVGGNNVPTNGTDSGVYDKDGKEVATFDVPQVNVPITSSVGTNDKVIYEGNSVNVKDLYDEVDTSGADSWKYDFVKISYAVKQGDAAVGNTEAPADCTDYKVTATFAPISDGEGAQGVANKMAGKSVDGTATVHVLKPTVTVNATDVWKYYGEDYNTPEGSTVTGSVTWADEHDHDISGITVIGSEPYGTDDLQYSYDHGKFVVPNTDTTIKVSAKVGDVEKASTSYVVHPKFCTLTVNKSVAKTYSNNDSFIFNVVGKGNVPYNAQVVITGNGSATLTGLPVGDYTVTEDTGWSWRYTCDNSSASTTLSASKDNDRLTITNKLTENNWLGNETFVINKCESKTIEKVSFIQQAIDFLLGR
ncbi:MAG: VWA domain-containing protein [Firmicutes bacterium]|nr:VWA domain-containing protein [Bacillota bacterium]